MMALVTSEDIEVICEGCSDDFLSFNNLIVIIFQGEVITILFFKLFDILKKGVKCYQKNNGAVGVPLKYPPSE